MKLSNKGNMQSIAVGGVITFVIVAVILTVMFPILNGVETAVPAIENTTTYLANGSVSGSIIGPLAASQDGNTVGIANGAGILSIIELIVAAIVVLGIIMTLSHRGSE
jgi:hypothetical protein